jgi:hypothetical protein
MRSSCSTDRNVPYDYRLAGPSECLLGPRPQRLRGRSGRREVGAELDDLRPTAQAVRRSPTGAYSALCSPACRGVLCGWEDRSQRMANGRPWAAVLTLVISSMWGPVASSPESHRLGRYAMTTIASTSVVVYDPDLVDPEHVALAGFLGGYRGVTSDAYALDLRQSPSACPRPGNSRLTRSGSPTLGQPSGHRSRRGTCRLTQSG